MSDKPLEEMDDQELSNELAKLRIADALRKQELEDADRRDDMIREAKRLRARLA